MKLLLRSVGKSRVSRRGPSLRWRWQSIGRRDCPGQLSDSVVTTYLRQIPALPHVATISQGREPSTAPRQVLPIYPAVCTRFRLLGLGQRLYAIKH